MQTAIELNDSLYHNQIQRIERKIYGELLKDSTCVGSPFLVQFKNRLFIYIFQLFVFL
jgi:hypothetical protein